MSQHQVSLTESAFGDVDGAPVTLFTFRSTSGLSISLCSLGCTITQCLVPDRGGAVADIVLAYDSVDAIRGGLRNFGSIVGRYANRIALGKFTLDGQEVCMSNLYECVTIAAACVHLIVFSVSVTCVYIACTTIARDTLTV